MHAVHVLADAAVVAVVLADVAELHDATVVNLIAKVLGRDGICVAEQRLLQLFVTAVRGGLQDAIHLQAVGVEQPM